MKVTSNRPTKYESSSSIIAVKSNGNLFEQGTTKLFIQEFKSGSPSNSDSYTIGFNVNHKLAMISGLKVVTTTSEYNDEFEMIVDWELDDLRQIVELFPDVRKRKDIFRWINQEIINHEIQKLG